MSLEQLVDCQATLKVMAGGLGEGEQLFLNTSPCASSGDERQKAGIVAWVVRWID